MNILILGAGAIGSLFGALLSTAHNVVLIGRRDHVDVMKKKGLTISGTTKMKVRIPAEESVKACKKYPVPDLVIITVKAYDTEKAIPEVAPFLTEETLVLSLQNGLDNLEIIGQYVQPSAIFGGVTSHGALFHKPGVVEHTGKGFTIVGEQNGEKTARLDRIVRAFNASGIETTRTSSLMQELWMKAIINSSINPLTAFFKCKNGYLLKNPMLAHVVEQVCRESTLVAQAHGLSLSSEEMWQKTQDVIQATAANNSSMLQSVQRGKKTEITSINGVIVDIGKQHGVAVALNSILVSLITSLEKTT